MVIYLNFILALGISLLVGVPLPLQAQDVKKEPSIEERKTHLFDQVDRLKNISDPSLENLHNVIDLPLSFYNSGAYKTPDLVDSDILRYDLPCNRERNIFAAEIIVAPRLPVTIGDVQKRYGKWMKKRKTSLRKSSSVTHDLEYLYDGDKLIFHFWSKNNINLSHVSVYY